MNDSKFTSKGRAVPALAIAAALLAPSSALADWQASVYEAAKKEGTVVVYASMFPDAVEAATKAFSKKYPGVAVQVSRSYDGAIALKIRQEKAVNATNGADIFSTDTYDIFDEEIDTGLLVPPAGPNAKPYENGGMYRNIAAFLTTMPVGITYNIDLVKTPPTTYEDLLKPEYRGVLGVQSAETGPMPTSWYDYLRKRYPGYWDKLKAQQPKYYMGSVPMVQAAASGEVAAANLSFPALASPLMAKGAPVKLVVDKTESFGVQLMCGILKSAPHPNAAQLFADFLLSREGQEALNGRGFGISVLPDVPGALPSTRIITADPKIYTPEYLKAILADWKAAFGQ